MESIRKNWQLLIDMLVNTQELLDPPKDVDLLPFLIKSKSKIEEHADVLKKQQLFTIGSVNLGKQFIFTINRLKGVIYGLRTGDMAPNKAMGTLLSTKQGLTIMVEEVRLKLDKQLLNKIVHDAKTEASDIDSEHYNNLTDAMQNVVRKLGKADSLSDIDKSSSRDVINISKIIQKNKTDLQSMKRTINAAKTNKSDHENFVFLKGPVLTGAKLDTIKLQRSGLDYDTVYFPGIHYNFIRKEETPRQYILRDQILIAILIGQRQRFQLKLNKTPLEKKIKQDNQNYKEMSTDVVKLLEERLHYPLVHVGEERGAYITSKNFPGIRFMWLMKKTVYDKIGPFSSSNVLELPF